MRTIKRGRMMKRETSRYESSITGRQGSMSDNSDVFRRGVGVVGERARCRNERRTRLDPIQSHGNEANPTKLR